MRSAASCVGLEKRVGSFHQQQHTDDGTGGRRAAAVVVRVGGGAERSTPHRRFTNETAIRASQPGGWVTAQPPMAWEQPNPNRRTTPRGRLRADRTTGRPVGPLPGTATSRWGRPWLSSSPRIEAARHLRDLRVGSGSNRRSAVAFGSGGQAASRLGPVVWAGPGLGPDLSRRLAAMASGPGSNDPTPSAARRRRWGAGES